MGTTHLRNQVHSQYTPISPPLQHINGKPILVKSNKTGIQLQQYEVLGTNHLATDINYSKNLVVVFDHQVVNQRQPRFHVCTQKMKSRMNQLQNTLTSMQTCCILEAALNGFGQLLSHAGQPFMVSDRMIALNQKEQVRVWANQNFAINKPEYFNKNKQISNNENTMIYQIFSCLSNCVIQEQRNKYCEFYNQFRRFNRLIQAKTYLSSYLGGINRKMVLSDVADKTYGYSGPKNSTQIETLHKIEIDNTNKISQDKRTPDNMNNTLVPANNITNQKTSSPKNGTTKQKQPSRFEKFGIAGMLYRLKDRQYPRQQQKSREKEKVNLPVQEYIKNDQDIKGTLQYQRTLKQNYLDSNNLAADKKNKISISLRGSRVMNNGSSNLPSFGNPQNNNNNPTSPTAMNATSFKNSFIGNNRSQGNLKPPKQQKSIDRKIFRQRSRSPDARLENNGNSKGTMDRNKNGQKQLIYEKSEIRDLRKSEIIVNASNPVVNNTWGFGNNPNMAYGFAGRYDTSASLFGFNNINQHPNHNNHNNNNNINNEVSNQQALKIKQGTPFKMQFKYPNQNTHPNQKNLIKFASIQQQIKGRDRMLNKQRNKDQKQQKQSKQISQKNIQTPQQDKSKSKNPQKSTDKSLGNIKTGKNYQTQEKSQNFPTNNRYGNTPYVSFNKPVFSGGNQNRLKTDIPLSSMTPKKQQGFSTKIIPSKNSRTPDKVVYYSNNNAYVGKNNYHYVTRNQDKYSPLKNLDRSADLIQPSNKTRFVYTNPNSFNSNNNNININGVKYEPTGISSNKNININGRKFSDYATFEQVRNNATGMNSNTYRKSYV